MRLDSFVVNGATLAAHCSVSWLKTLMTTWSGHRATLFYLLMFWTSTLASGRWRTNIMTGEAGWGSRGNIVWTKDERQTKDSSVKRHQLNNDVTCSMTSRGWRALETLASKNLIRILVLFKDLHIKYEVWCSLMIEKNSIDLWQNPERRRVVVVDRSTLFTYF